MSQSLTSSDNCLDFELKLTSRILTHKLSACPVNFGTGASGLQASFYEQNKLPLNELWKILNSIDDRVNPVEKESKVCVVDMHSGICVTNEGRSWMDDEEEKRSVRILSNRRSSIQAAFKPYVKNPELCDSNFSENLVKIQVEQDSEANEPKYEKKNIYYKAVFRDIRRYFIEILKWHSSSRLEESIYKLLQSLDISKNSHDINEMTSILAPFLNYNKYMIEFENKRVQDAQIILDCLQNFTLTKMRNVLKYDVIKFAVTYYQSQTVTQGVSVRFNSHKTMKNDSQKYLEVLKKIVDISNKR